MRNASAKVTVECIYQILSLLFPEAGTSCLRKVRPVASDLFWSK
jgi:hypothetical protein